MSASDTPFKLGRYMAELLFSAPLPPTALNRRRALRVLEPSAGEGSLAKTVIDVGNGSPTRRPCEEGAIHLTLVDNDTSHFSRLVTLGNVLHQADFLKLPRSVLGAPFDRIIMAPPLYTEAEHVLRAFSMLAEGGRLVALVSTAYKTFSAERYAAVRKIVDSRPRKDGARFMIAEDIRVGQFGTDRSGVVLVLDN